MIVSFTYNGLTISKWCAISDPQIPSVVVVLLKTISINISSVVTTMAEFIRIALTAILVDDSNTLSLFLNRSPI